MTTAGGTRAAAPREEPAYVADLLPATAPLPEPARRINFLKALLLFWLLPRRYGPHLAVDSFRRALAAHLVSLLIGAAFLGAPTLVTVVERSGAEFSLHSVRLSLAEGVFALAYTSANAKHTWLMPLMVFGAVPLIQIPLLLIATALMPWCAGGDRASSVWKRSVKNVYWCTTITIPLAVAATTIRVVNLEMDENGSPAILLGMCSVVVPVVLILRMFFVGAGRYVGPPDGPAFASREPRCDACGYALIRLPVDLNCPECGLAVRESLPGGRRRPTVWQHNELRARGFVDLIRLQRVVLLDPMFFRRLQVQSGLPAARHFWWGTLLLIAVTFLAGGKLGLSLLPERSKLIPFVGGFVVVLPAVVVLQAGAMFVACLWSQFRLGIQDYRVSAVVCYYAAPLLWPVLLACGGFVGTAALVDASTTLDRIVHSSASGTLLTRGHLLLVAAGAVPLATLCWWARRLARAVQAVRYANV